MSPNFSYCFMSTFMFPPPQDAPIKKLQNKNPDLLEILSIYSIIEKLITQRSNSTAPTISSLLHFCPRLATYWRMCKCCATCLLPIFKMLCNYSICFLIIFFLIIFICRFKSLIQIDQSHDLNLTNKKSWFKSHFFYFNWFLLLFIYLFYLYLNAHAKNTYMLLCSN